MCAAWYSESVADLSFLGVGINLQPNDVRELYERWASGPKALDAVGIQTRGSLLNGHDVYCEPRP